jgi:hypothetical protein
MSGMNGDNEGPRHATEGLDRQASEFSSPSVTPPADCVNNPCCTPSAARAWVDDLVFLTRQGDPDANRVLPSAIAHYLQTEREVCCGYAS